MSMCGKARAHTQIYRHISVSIYIYKEIYDHTRTHMHTNEFFYIHIHKHIIQNEHVHSIIHEHTDPVSCTNTHTLIHMRVHRPTSVNILIPWLFIRAGNQYYCSPFINTFPIVSKNLFRIISSIVSSIRSGVRRMPLMKAYYHWCTDPPPHPPPPSYLASKFTK